MLSAKPRHYALGLSYSQLSSLFCKVSCHVTAPYVSWFQSTARTKFSGTSTTFLFRNKAVSGTI